MSRPSSCEGTSRIGSYVIDHQVGEGATARVFAARHERSGHPVAVKVLRRELVHALRARFEHEMQALAEIDSRHVPEVHDVGELSDGTPYVVMQRLVGENLAAQIEREGYLPIEQVISIGTQLAAALAAVHAAGWVHRDVKPSNLVMHEESDGRTVLKLCDFGIATRVGGSSRRLTLAGRLVGTPDYMSPEQACGLTVGPPSDVFAMGSVLYELLTGRAPFESEGATPRAIALAVIQRDPPPLRSLRADCPPWLERVITRALAKRIPDRYSSANELGAALAAPPRCRPLYLTEGALAVPRPSPRRASLAMVLAGLAMMSVLLTAVFVVSRPDLARIVDERAEAWYIHAKEVVTTSAAVPGVNPRIDLAPARSPTTTIEDNPDHPSPRANQEPP